MTPKQAKFEVDALEFSVTPSGTYTVNLQGYQINATCKRGKLKWTVDGSPATREEIIALLTQPEGY